MSKRQTATRYVGMQQATNNMTSGSSQQTTLIESNSSDKLVRKYEEQSNKSTNNEQCAAGCVQQAGINNAAIRDQQTGKLHAGRQQSTINNQQSTINNQQSTINNQQSTINNQQSTINNQQSTINNQQSTINNQQSTINNQQSTINNQQSTINNQQSTINNQQSTINNQQSTINNQQSTINNQQSTINNQRTHQRAHRGLTNGRTNTSGVNTSSLRQLTIPSYVLDDEFHSPMRIFVLKDNSHVDRVMVDSGAAHSTCPSDYANEHEVREVQRKIQFQTASGELLEHHGEKLVPYMAQESIVGNSYQVTAVEGPVAAVSSLNDSGMTVVFSPQGAWVCDETPLKPTGVIELKRENRTFWMDLPRADSGKVQRMMALRREQPVEQVEQIAGNPAIEEKRQEMSPSTDPVTQDNEDDPVARARKPPPGPAAEELDRHELSHVVFRSWCKHCISSRAREDPHRRVATHEGRTPKVMLDWMFLHK